MMKYRKGNCLVGQSGGPTSIINASAAGVIEAAIASPYIEKIYGAHYGIEGILNDDIFDFSKEDEENLKLLKYSPSSALGACRYKLKPYMKSIEEYERVFSQFKKYNIKYFVYIGRNDSMDTVDKLNSYAKSINFDINIIGVPKTIDNDLFGTDHCPGFGSAAKYVATSIIELSRDGAVYDNEIINIVEVMGRNAGWLAASSILAKTDIQMSPDMIYLPEVIFDVEEFITKLIEKFNKKKKLTVVVSEGIKDKSGRYICEIDTLNKDIFGHAQMGGVGDVLGNLIKEKVCKRVKVVELNILQRCAMHWASKTDIDEAYKCGLDAVEYALGGYTGKMVTLERVSEYPYFCKTGLIDIEKVANREKKYR